MICFSAVSGSSGGRKPDVQPGALYRLHAGFLFDHKKQKRF